MFILSYFFQIVSVSRFVWLLRTRVTKSTISFSDAFFVAVLATRYTAESFVFSIIKLPLQQIVTLRAQVIHRRCGKLLSQLGAFIVHIFELILMLLALALLSYVSSLR